MKWTTFSIFCILYVALMLFAEHRPSAASHQFSAAYDLSTESTVLHAPAEAQENGWRVGQIPPQRLVAPLVILRSDEDGRVTLREVVRFEKENGAMFPGALVIVDTPRARFDFEALRFLAEARSTYGLAATGTVDFISSAPFIAAKGIYVIDHAALPREVRNGVIVTVAPEKADTEVAPARLLALEQDAR